MEEQYSALDILMMAYEELKAQPESDVVLEKNLLTESDVVL